MIGLAPMSRPAPILVQSEADLLELAALSWEDGSPPTPSMLAWMRDLAARIRVADATLHPPPPRAAAGPSDTLSRG